MSDLTKTLEYLRDIINAPAFNILIVAGICFIALSFFSFNGITNLKILSSPNWLIFAIGCVLGFSGIGGHIGINVSVGRRERGSTLAKIKQGLRFKLGRTIVVLKMGKIQDTDGLDREIAVVLPVNTTFMDDCIYDKRSATGAYILEFYSNEISKIPGVMKEQLEKFGYGKSENGTYDLGTTILLPSPYDTPAKILMTASTFREEKVGIKAEPNTICDCVQKIFEFTADKKINKFRMPVLGSGHGGLDINEALALLMINIKYYSENLYHHVKETEIIITENDISKLKECSIQYFATLGEEK